jgi:hypothetical protein
MTRSPSVPLIDPGKHTPVVGDGNRSGVMQSLSHRHGPCATHSEQLATTLVPL